MASPPVSTPPSSRAPALAFEKQFDAQPGMPIPVAPGIVRITAPNAGPFTFTGTNSFVVGDQRIAVIDPGPNDDAHLSALRAHIGTRPVDAIILTHTHRDHSDLVSRLRAATGAPLWFAGPHRLSRPARGFEARFIRRSSDWTLTPDRVLADGERIALDGVTLEAIATPGHCANHLAFGIEGTPWALSGDHVMGWSSTLVSVPDGSMADYLASLDRIAARPYAHYLPAHGGPIADGPGFARALKAHREGRNAQVIAAVEKGARTVGGLLRAIYPDLALNLIPAARMTLIAHVEYLAERGAITARRGWLGWRLSPAA